MAESTLAFPGILFALKRLDKARVKQRQIARFEMDNWLDMGQPHPPDDRQSKITNPKSKIHSPRPPRQPVVNLPKGALHRAGHGLPADGLGEDGEGIG